MGRGGRGGRDGGGRGTVGGRWLIDIQIPKCVAMFDII